MPAQWLNPDGSPADYGITTSMMRDAKGDVYNNIGKFLRVDQRPEGTYQLYQDASDPNKTIAAAVNFNGKNDGGWGPGGWLSDAGGALAGAATTVATGDPQLGYQVGKGTASSLNNVNEGQSFGSSLQNGFLGGTPFGGQGQRGQANQGQNNMNDYMGSQQGPNLSWPSMPNWNGWGLGTGGESGSPSSGGWGLNLPGFGGPGLPNLGQFGQLFGGGGGQQQPPQQQYQQPQYGQQQQPQGQGGYAVPWQAQLGAAAGGLIGRSLANQNIPLPNAPTAPSSLGTALTADDIKQQYQQHLGRAPTDQETASFMQAANNGSVRLSANDVGSVLRSLPEYQGQQLQGYGNQIGNVLGQSDQRILGLAQDQIGSQFAQNGRPNLAGNSGYINAFAQAAQNLAMGRQQQLAGFLGPGYQNIMNNTAAQGNNTTQYGQGQATNAQNFNQGQYWYGRQGGDYNSYLNANNAQNSRAALYGGGGQLLGAGLGGVLASKFPGFGSSVFGGGNRPLGGLNG